MKTYFVITRTEVNRHHLHSLGVGQFSTTSLKLAKAVFRKELDWLSKEYKTKDKLNYSPSDYEMNHAVFCEIISIDDDNELVCVKCSEYFFQEPNN